MKIDAVIYPKTPREEKVVIIAISNGSVYYVDKNASIGVIALPYVKVTDKDYIPLGAGSIGF